jgi:hypothetical protein
MDQIIQNINIIKEKEKQEDVFLFYKEDLHYVMIHSIYINTNNEIYKILEEKCFFKELNSLSRDQLLQIIKKNSIQQSKKYSLLSILKYNIDLEPNDITSYMKNPTPFLYLIKNIDNIVFNKTISIFHDLNDLFILFFEKSETELANMREKQNNYNSTKKIYIMSNKHKKTIRK